jgi:uncharacterized protein
MTELDLLAREVATSGRTLRRAAARGLIQAARPSARKLVVSAGERLYVLSHWALLSTLVQALRKEPNVRLAVLFGSVARGEEGRGSDVDLLVRLRRNDYRVRGELVDALENAAGTHVQVFSLEQADEAPLLLADVLREGRVLVDRDGDWSRLKRREPRIARRAREEEKRLERAAWEAPETLERILEQVSAQPGPRSPDE